MFQEQNGPKILGEHICQIIGSWYSIEFYCSILYLFMDVVIADFNVLNTLLGNRILCIIRKQPSCSGCL